MRLEKLAFRNLISKPLSLILNLLLLVFSVFLVTFFLQLRTQMNGKIKKNIAPFDLIVGAKGSPLQLVLSSVLHLDAPTGNISFREAKKISEHPFVKVAIPVLYGDNYKGYRLLGTEISYVESYDAKLLKGRFFKEAFEVVVGARVAKELGLDLGSSFVSSHGLVDSEHDLHRDHPFTVVGILESSETVLDQLLITNKQSVWEAHTHKEEQEVLLDFNASTQKTEKDHDLEIVENHDDHSVQDDAEITSLLIKFKNPLGLVQLPRLINENTNMQAALPRYEVQRIERFFGVTFSTVNTIAIVILFISGLSIFISLAVAIRERKHELALLRTFGIGSIKLFYLVLCEGIILSFVGSCIGWLVGRIGLLITGRYIQLNFGYSLGFVGPQRIELFFFGVILFLTILAAILSSISIFKMNISQTLTNE